MNGIKKRREAAGMTQNELAALVGVSSSGIVSMWETGERTPRVVILKQLSEVFNCTIDDLLTDTKEADGNAKAES